jgi:hypothetical protein
MHDSHLLLYSFVQARYKITMIAEVGMDSTRRMYNLCNIEDWLMKNIDMKTKFYSKDKIGFFFFQV